jgi:hypothetical protein
LKLPGTLIVACFFKIRMEVRIRSVIRKFTLVYLDGVIIYSTSIEQHMKQKDIVLRLLRKVGLKIKLSKCMFLETSVNYLGHVISDQGIIE